MAFVINGPADIGVVCPEPVTVIKKVVLGVSLSTLNTMFCPIIKHSSIVFFHNVQPLNVVVVDVGGKVVVEVVELDVDVDVDVEVVEDVAAAVVVDVVLVLVLVLVVEVDVEVEVVEVGGCVVVLDVVLVVVDDVVVVI